MNEVGYGQKEPASKLLGQKVPGQKELHHRTKSTSYLYLKQIVTFISITHVNFICISFNTLLSTFPYNVGRLHDATNLINLFIYLFRTRTSTLNNVDFK